MLTNGKRAAAIALTTILAFSIASFLGLETALAQEHPHEHPMSKKAEVTIGSLAEAITKYVNDDAGLKGGFFMLYDKVQGKALALTLQKVHEDRLGALGNDTYFACADFNGTDGNLYDIDIFMKDTGNGMKATDVSVHKKNGEARYNWVEKDGIWSKEEL